MAEEGLKIKIGADVQSAITSLNSLNSSLAKTGDAAVKVSTAGMGNLTKGTGQASIALTNFSRVASDAPFGLIGIANNIDPLVQSFVNLRKETGSVKGALAALTASLTGGGGLILAVSLITSALQFAQLGLSRWGQSTEKANDATKKAKEELDKYTEAQKNSVKNTTLQRLEIDSLVATAKNLNLSEKDRINAINRLNEIIPDNIGYITQQNIATDQGTKIITEYVKAVEAKATAELFANKIAENNAKLFENRNKTLEETTRIEGEIEKRRRQAFVQSSGSVRLQKEANLLLINNKIANENILKIQKEGRAVATQLQQENEKLRNEYLKLLPVVNTLNKDNNKGIKENTDLLREYNEQLKGINWDEQNRQIDGTKKRLELAGETLKNLYLAGVNETSAAWIRVKTDFDQFQSAFDKFVRDNRLAEINKQVQDYTDNIGSYTEKALGETQKKVVKALNETGKLFLENYKAQQKALSDLQKKNEELANTISGFLTPALENVFDAAVKGEDPFEVLQNSVKQLVIELGKAVIKSLILKAVTSAIGGPAAGAIGANAAGAGLATMRGDVFSFLLSRGR